MSESHKWFKVHDTWYNQTSYVKGPNVDCAKAEYMIDVPEVLLDDLQVVEVLETQVPHKFRMGLA